MTKVVQTSSVDMGAYIFDSLNVDGIPAEDQIEINTALALSKELSKVGEFTELNGKSYVSLPSLGLAMHTLLRANVGNVSDGSHTFNELYDHRCTLFLCLMCLVAEHGAEEYGISNVWWSEKHADGTMFEGYVIVGLDTPMGQCTYHVKDTPYGEILRSVFATNPAIKYLDKAPEWDGHDSSDVLTRLTSSFLGGPALDLVLGNKA